MTSTSVNRLIRFAAYNRAAFQQDGEPVWASCSTQ